MPKKQLKIYDEYGHGPEADLLRHLWEKAGKPDEKEFLKSFTTQPESETDSEIKGE